MIRWNSGADGYSPDKRRYRLTNVCGLVCLHTPKTILFSGFFLKRSNDIFGLSPAQQAIRCESFCLLYTVVNLEEAAQSSNNSGILRRYAPRNSIWNL